MHSHDLISVSVGKYGQRRGNLSLILQAAAGKYYRPTPPGRISILLFPALARGNIPCAARLTAILMNLRQAGGRLHRRLTLFAPAAQSRRSARHFAAAQPFSLPQAGRYLLFAGGIGITPLLAMAEAIAARKGALELHYYVASSRQTAFSRAWLSWLRAARWRFTAARKASRFASRSPNA
jgi:vanillate O-demethylase ferredoxin subunit